MKDNNIVQVKTGAGVKEVNFSQLTKLPIAQYLQLKGRFLNTESARYYDTAAYLGGVAITPAHSALLFARGLGTAAVLTNQPATPIGAKKETLTNMTGNGEFQNGEDFILEGVEVDVVFGSIDAVFTNGEIATPNNSAADPVGYSAANHLIALNHQMKLSFIRGTKKQVIFSGLLADFPPSQLLSGAFGNVADGFVQNYGNGSYRVLNNARVLGSEEPFHCLLEPLAESFTPQLSFNIRVSLVGTYVGTLYE